MKDKVLTSALGWNLLACFDGERVTLHVENASGQSSSLDCAVNEGEVYDHKKGHEVALKGPTMKLFERWFDQYDAFVDEAMSKPA
jgi:hypothetical protein